ncbi:MAG: SEC-C domain-containing protein [Oscillospiraceae bacterium]|nr:SEC-C domain-containing protein [Oscillospiraceae bacterium]
MAKPMMTINQEYYDMITQVEEQLPEARGRIRLAYISLLKGDTEKTLELCDEILAMKAEFKEIEFLKAEAYFNLGTEEDLDKSLEIIEKLKEKDPADKDIVVMEGKIYHSKQDYGKAIDTLLTVVPLEVYEPYVYLTLANALDRTGRSEEALRFYHMDIEYFIETGDIKDPGMLEGAFQNAMCLDVTLEPYSLRRDLDAYKKFLISTENLDEDLQKYVAQTIILLSRFIDRKWVRKLFSELLDYIDERVPLMSLAEFTVNTGHSSVESYNIREDKNISAFTDAYYGNVSGYVHYCMELKVSEEYDDHKPEIGEDEVHALKLNYLTYNWYMCKYYEDHKKEMDYLNERYPYMREMFKDIFARIETDKDAYMLELVDGIREEYFILKKDKLSRNSIREDLSGGFAQVLIEKKAKIQVQGGGVIIRSTDPCPCGSGLRYRDCCGRIG